MPLFTGRGHEKAGTGPAFYGFLENRDQLFWIKMFGNLLA